MVFENLLCCGRVMQPQLAYDLPQVYPFLMKVPAVQLLLIFEQPGQCSGSHGGSADEQKNMATI